MVATGTYVLQANRAAYNLNNYCEARCQLHVSGEEDETLSHFLLWCLAMEETRHPIIFKAIDDIQHRMATTRLELELSDLTVDCTRLINVYGADMVKQEHIQWLQYQSNRLVYTLHALRFKKLEFILKPKKMRLKRK